MLARYWQKNVVVVMTIIEKFSTPLHSSLTPPAPIFCMNLNFSTYDTSKSGLLVRLYNGEQVVCRVILFSIFL